MNEPGIHLSLHQRTVMVGLDTVRAVIGADAAGVMARVEDGRLRWVWDISGRKRVKGLRSGPAVRELRFWARELIAPDLCAELPPERVVELMLGPQRRRRRAVETAQLLLCSRAGVMRMAKAGELDSRVERRVRWITRASLAAFLRRRLLSKDA